MDRPILIVEDSEDSVASLQIALECAFHSRVVHIENGAQALSFLEKLDSPARAVITDLHLPGAEGWEILERLRDSARRDRTAVLVISADPDPRTPRRALAAGADAFFGKPFSPSEVCRELERILHEKDTSDRPAPLADGPPGPDHPTGIE